MQDNSTTTTWWLWEASIDHRGIRIIVEVKTTIANGFRVDTPISYFGECETGGEDLRWLGERVMIENDEFARLRAAGVIRPLSPEWDIPGRADA